MYYSMHLNIVNVLNLKYTAHMAKFIILLIIGIMVAILGYWVVDIIALSGSSHG